MQALSIYLAIINAAALLLMLADKAKAKNRTRRIPEAALFGAALLGGSLGCILGMYMVRHKTLHRSFTLGMPLILLLQVITLLLLFRGDILSALTA